jgi:macrodomain Ter protein organizer (MatP/YcbG family)
MKHRKSWVNPLLRRRDSSVDTDYVNNVFRSLHSNLLAATLLETVVKLADISEMSQKTKRTMKTERVTGDDFFSSGHIDYLVNRAKMAMDDPSAKNPFGWLDASSIANTLNKYVTDGREWTEDDAYRLMKRTRAFFSTLLLGFQGAMFNRTQTTNDFIHIGWSYLSRAFSDFNDKKNLPKQEWIRAVIQATGTDQALTAFADAMAPAGDIEFSDVGFLPLLGTGIHIPMQPMRDWARMLATNPDKFIEEGVNDEVDEYLNLLEDERLASALKGRRRRFWKLLDREQKRLRSHTDRNNIETLRKNFVDLINAPTDDVDLLKEKFIRQLGIVSDTRMKRMLAAKLSLPVPSAIRSARHWVTFTGGEEEMRAVTVLSNLYAARDAGTLGSEGFGETVITIQNEKGEDVDVVIDDIFLSDEAVRVARRAVRNTMYGMSKEHMGDYFAGWGQAVMQYKEYPIQQMIHDWEVVKAMNEGSMFKGDFVRRISSEIHNATTRWRKGIPYNITDPHIDHEALAAARLIMTRGAMSIIGTAVDTMKLYHVFRRDPSLNFASSMIKGGENPVMAIAVRLLFWSIYGPLVDDDDEKKSLAKRLGRLTIRLMLPLIITIWPSLISQAYRSIDSGVDWIDSKTSVF